MIGAFPWLLVFQLAGEIITQAAGLPVPGPVLGMALLFAALVWRGNVPVTLGNAAASLLSHLSLLFVPAGVGVMVHAGRIGDEWLAITAALLGSTLIALGLTALVLDRLAGRKRGDEAR